MKINSFTLYREYYDLITLLSDKEQANVLLAIARYMFDNEEIKLSDRENKVFVNLKRPLEKSKNKSQNANKNKSKQNQNEIKIDNKQQSKQHTHLIVSNYDNNYAVNVNGNVNIFGFIESNFNRTLSPIEFTKIYEWLNLFSEDIVKYAIEISVLNGKKTFQYTDGILKNWKSCNLNTLQEIKEAELKGKKNNLKITPEWIEKEVQEDTASEEEIKKLEERMKR